MDQVSAPQCGFELSASFRQVKTIGELRIIGAMLKNCVRDVGCYGESYWFRLAEGSTVYIVLDEPALLACLRRFGPDLWMIDELAGRNNCDATPEEKDPLKQALQMAGVRLVKPPSVQALPLLQEHPNPAGDPIDPLFEIEDEFIQL